MHRVHFIGVEVDLCDLKSVYALAGKLVNGTVGSPEARTMDGGKLPHGSPGTHSYSKDIKQDRWALSEKPGSTGAQRSWGWGLSDIRIPRLDVIILNAGIGGWIGLNWPLAIKQVLTDLTEGVTWPLYKLTDVGAVTRSQVSTEGTKTGDSEASSLLSLKEKPNEPPLGSVFCSNVFGHYILAHELMPLLSRPSSPSSKSGGKIVLMSSVEAMSASFLSLDDIQGLRSLNPYESSKRLVDVLALSSNLPSVHRASASFFDAKDTVTTSQAKAAQAADEDLPLVKPRILLTHPGIFASEILPLPSILVTIYTFVFLIARWLGSPWHTVSPWKAAVAPVWLALADDELLDDMGGSKSKWGSATDTSGEERVMRTFVPGWGWDGTLALAEESKKKTGRTRHAVEVTKESREEFEVVGSQAWKEMEELRKEWEAVLGFKGGRK